MLALLPLAGCVDAVLDDGSDESVGPDGANESLNNTTAGNDTGEVIVGEEPVAPTPGPGPVTTTPEATPTVTTPLTPIEVSPTPPAPTTTPPPTTEPTPPPPTTTTTPTPTTQPPPTTTTQPAPTTTTPAPQAWPREGSFVKYTFREGQAFGGSDQRWTEYGNVTWTYRNGDWHGVCEMQRYDFSDGETWENTTHTREFTASSPPHWPPMNTRSPPPVGSEITVWYVQGCALDQETLIYRGTTTEATTVNGQPYVASTHHAEDDWPPEQPMSWDTEWSAATGLVIYWGYSRGGMAPHSDSGRLVDTDAPL